MLSPEEPGEVLTSSGPSWHCRHYISLTAYWNSARQRHCRPSERYKNIPASLPTRSPSHPRKPARKAGFGTFESGCGRETDCLLEQSGFELSVPLALKLVVSRKRELDGGILIGEDDGMIP